MQPGYEGFAKLGDMLSGGVKRDSEKAYVDQTNRNYIAYGNLEQARKERAQAMIAQGQVDARGTLEARIAESYKARGLAPQDAGVASAFALTNANPDFNTHESGTAKVADATMDSQILEALEKGDIKRARILSAVKTDKVLPQLRGDEVFDAVSAVATPTKLGEATIDKRNYRAQPKATKDASDPGTDVDFYAQISAIQDSLQRNLKPAEVKLLEKQYKATGEINFKPYGEKLGDKTTPDSPPTSADADATMPRMDDESAEMTALKDQAKRAIKAGKPEKEVVAMLRSEIARLKLRK